MWRSLPSSSFRGSAGKHRRQDGECTMDISVRLREPLGLGTARQLWWLNVVYFKMRLQGLGISKCSYLNADEIAYVKILHHSRKLDREIGDALTIYFIHLENLHLILSIDAQQRSKGSDETFMIIRLTNDASTYVLFVWINPGEIFQIWPLIWGAPCSFSHAAHCPLSTVNIHHEGCPLLLVVASSSLLRVGDREGRASNTRGRQGDQPTETLE